MYTRGYIGNHYKIKVAGGVVSISKPSGAVVYTATAKGLVKFDARSGIVWNSGDFGSRRSFDIAPARPMTWIELVLSFAMCAFLLYLSYSIKRS